MIGPFSGEYRFLSNFWVEPARGGLTNEHFFQAEKSFDAEDRAFVMRAPSAGAAKKRGRMINLREDWDAVKDTVMLSGLRSKFYSDPELRRKLIDTGDEYLAEVNHWGDTYWGVEVHTLPGWETPTYQGKNMLGILLMQVRAELAWTQHETAKIGDINKIVPEGLN
jgi:ribA/ribD-fused uncharacterized protein